MGRSCGRTMRRMAKPRSRRASTEISSRATRGPARTDWGKVAGWYDQLVGEAGSEYHRQVVLPGVIRLLSPQPGQKMVDIACGQGVLCRLLYERGIEMTGIDASRELIAAARERS